MAAAGHRFYRSANGVWLAEEVPAAFIELKTVIAFPAPKAINTGKAHGSALGEDEVITAVSFPVPEKAGWQKFKQPASRFALVGVFVAQTAGGVRVAVTGAAGSAFRCQPLEAALGRSFTPEAAKAVKVSADGLNSDLHGSAEYRAALIPVLAGRAVASAA